MEEDKKGREIDLSPEWKETITENLEGTLDSYELLDQCVNTAEVTLMEGDEDGKRASYELTPSEQAFIKETLFRLLNFNEINPVQVVEYVTETPVKEGEDTTNKEWLGKAVVKVYETGRSEPENMYLHEVHLPNGEMEYFVAPKEREI